MQISARPQTKNLRVVLPRDDAEDLSGNRGRDAAALRATWPFVLNWTQHITRGGQAVNPIRDGFHLIKRKRPPIPFTPGRKNLGKV